MEKAANIVGQERDKAAAEASKAAATCRVIIDDILDAEARTLAVRIGPTICRPSFLRRDFSENF